MAKKRITRKELVKKPDEFITLSGTAIQWARSNAKLLTYGAVAFFVIIVSVAGYRYYVENRERAAAMLLSHSMAAYEEAIRAQQDPAKALAMVQSDLEQLVDTFDGYDAGQLGRLFYAHISLSAAMPDQAIALYTEAMGSVKGNEGLGNTIYNGLAMAHMQKGERAAAIDYFEKVLEGPSAVLKDAALFQLGRLYGVEGDAQKSLSAYKRLNTDFPDSIYANIAREKSAG